MVWGWFGRKCLSLRWIKPRAVAFEWAWLGVWERNFKGANFYYRFWLNDLVNTNVTGDTVDTGPVC